MAEVLGFQTILSLALPTGLDGTRLQQWRMRDGGTFSEFANQVAAALTGYNQEMVDKWGGLFSLTDMDYLEYEQGGGTTELQDLTDVDRPDPLYAETIGHMIELRPQGRAIGGSKRWFRDHRQAQVTANLRTITRIMRRTFERRVLTRIFHNTETAIGSSGYNVPFVRGTGGNVDYCPPAFDGEEFTTAHNHYNGYATASYGFGSFLNALAEHLQEHGHEPPFYGLVSRTDVGSYRALPDFVRPMGGTPVVIIDQGGETDRPVFFSEETREFGMIGGYDTDYGYIELHATARIPTGYASVHKSYGQLDERNPLAIRVHPDVGFGVYVVPETTDDRQYPLKQLDVEFEVGIGVGMDRTNGVIGRLVAGGAWATPTIG
jgi:hypothetical protein